MKLSFRERNGTLSGYARREIELFDVRRGRVGEKKKKIRNNIFFGNYKFTRDVFEYR